MCHVCLSVTGAAAAAAAEVSNDVRVTSLADTADEPVGKHLLSTQTHSAVRQHEGLARTTVHASARRHAH